MRTEPQRVLVAMSGGVDSSVAALLLCGQGYHVTGVTMDTGYGQAPEKAAAVCRQLGISHIVLDVRQQFRAEVMQPFIAAYLSGETPNPCVRCNQFLKFRIFEPLLTKYDAQFLATGHYCRLAKKGERFVLHCGVDAEKDQTYFLYGIEQQMLAHYLFPLGALQKDQVRRLARESGLLSAQVKDSYDICFIENGDYRTLVGEDPAASRQAGDIVDPSGRVVGRHNGLANYTIGQRRGLEIALGYPAYVTAIDLPQNRLYVGPREMLFTRVAYTTENNFFPFPVLTEPLSVQVKVRYRAPAKQATIRPLPEGDGVEISFTEDVWGITPGQAAVFYDGDMLVGGGRLIRRS